MKTEITFTQTMYEHALFRFTSFIEKHGYEKGKFQYLNRVNKMTNIQKICATIAVAKHCGERNIARFAQERLNQLV